MPTGYLHLIESAGQTVKAVEVLRISQKPIDSDSQTIWRQLANRTFLGQYFLRNPLILRVRVMDGDKRRRLRFDIQSI